MQQSDCKMARSIPQVEHWKLRSTIAVACGENAYQSMKQARSNDHQFRCVHALQYRGRLSKSSPPAGLENTTKSQHWSSLIPWNPLQSQSSKLACFCKTTPFVALHSPTHHVYSYSSYRGHSCAHPKSASPSSAGTTHQPDPWYTDGHRSGTFPPDPRWSEGNRNDCGCRCPANDEHEGCRCWQ